MLYYADKISENIRRREPEGYLICVNVPIARSGTQQYMQDELGFPGEKMVTVYRPEEEVFSPATMSSFEGMPVTNDHPDTEDGVTAENSQFYAKGHVQNVRRGKGEERNMLVADLVIMDPDTIQAVLDGKREISCGYNYNLCEEDGRFIQRQIRGNHVAIVDKGRAGKRVCIKDSAPKKERRLPKMEKEKKNHVGILSKMLASFVRDAEPEEVEAAVDAIEEITTDAELTETPTPEALPVQQQDEEAPDKLDTVIELLNKLLAAKTVDEDPAAKEEDPLAKLEDDLNEIEKKEEEEETFAPDEDPEEPEAHFVDPEQINEEDEEPEAIEGEEEEEEENVMDKRACDAARMALNVIKPVIAKLPAAERKAAADAAVAAIRKSSGLDAKPSRNAYVALKKRRKAGDSKREDPSELGKRITAARNINYQK